MPGGGGRAKDAKKEHEGMVKQICFILMLLAVALGMLATACATSLPVSNTWTECPSIIWEISADGTLTLKPATEGGTGTIKSHVTTAAGDAPSNMGALFPWYNYRSQITSIKFEGNITTEAQAELRYMFYNLSAVTSVDLSSFDMSKVEVMNDMFRGCSSLQSISFSNAGATSNVKQINRIFRDCTALKTIDFSGLNLNLTQWNANTFSNCNPETISIHGNLSSYVVNNLFKNKTSLKTVDLSGSTISGGTVSTMFSGSTNIENLNISGTSIGDNILSGQNSLKSLNISNMNNPGAPFNLSGVPVGTVITTDGNTYVTIRGGEWDLNGQGGLEEDDVNALIPGGLLPAGTLTKTGLGSNVGGTINGQVEWKIKNGKLTIWPTNGTYGEMSNFPQNTPLPWAEYGPAIDEVEVQGRVRAASALVNMFKGFNNLTRVDVSGLDVTGANVSGMFSGCSSLKSLTLEFDSASGAASTNNSMFENCSSLEYLDLSKASDVLKQSLPNSTWAGCSALKTLDVSNITATAFNLNANDVPNLEKLIAVNSNIRFNGSNSPFTEESAWEYNNGATVEKLDGSMILMDDYTDINYMNMNAAPLKPGIYTKVADVVWGFEEVGENFYIIDNLDQYTIQINGETITPESPNRSPGGVDSGPYYIEKSGTKVDIYSKCMSRDVWETTNVSDATGPGYEYDMVPDAPDIIVTFKDAAIDKNGFRHDVTIKIDKFTIYNPSNVRIVNPDLAEYRRSLMIVDIGRLSYANYVRNKDPGGTPIAGVPYNRGSGTYTDTTISIDGATADQTFLFYVDDLDVGINPNAQQDQAWGYPGGEGIILRDGFDLDTLKLGDRTRLRTYDVTDSGYQIATYSYFDDAASKQDLINKGYGVATGQNGNYITGYFNQSQMGEEGYSTKLYGTRNDGQGNTSSYRTRFYVSGSAVSSSYTWTSGTNCDANFLTATAARQVWEPLPPIPVPVRVLKALDGGVPDSSYDGDFTAEMKLTKIQTVDAHGNAIPDLTTEMEIDLFLSQHPNVQIIKSALLHNVEDVFGNFSMLFDQIGTYCFTLKEIRGTDPDIEYDGNTYEVRIVISGVLNDNDMVMGYQAQIFADDRLLTDTRAPSSLTWLKAVSTTTGLTTADFQRRVWTDGADSFAYDPNTGKWRKNGGNEQVDRLADTATASFTLNYAQAMAAVSRSKNQGFDAALVQSVEWKEGSDAYSFRSVFPVTYGNALSVGLNQAAIEAITWTDPATGEEYTYDIVSAQWQKDGAPVPGEPPADAAATLTGVWLKNGTTLVIAPPSAATHTFTQLPYGIAATAESTGFALAELEDTVWTWVDDTDPLAPVTYTYTYIQGVGWVQAKDNGDPPVLVSEPYPDSEADFWPVSVTDVATFDNWHRYDLTLKKLVAGNLGSKSRTWSFDIQLTGRDGKPLTGLEVNGLEEYYRRPGVYKATLGHGDAIVIPQLYCNTAYAITEELRGDYTVRIGVTGDTEGVRKNSPKVSDAALTDHTTVTYTNEWDVPVPTGIEDSVAPALAGMLAALTLLALAQAGRRRRHGGA